METKPGRDEMNIYFKEGWGCYRTRIIIVSDLNCGGYCFIMSHDNSIPTGLRGGKKHKDLIQIHSQPRLHSVVKLVSQGQGTTTEDTPCTILSRRLPTFQYAITQACPFTEDLNSG